MQPIFKENLKADGFFPSNSYKKWTLLTHFLLNSCLGDWFVGKNHFFAVANTKESRKDEKFRCFLKNRDDDYFLGQSITPECNQIRTVEQAPVRMELDPVRSLTVEPGCFLPENFTGQWVNTANIDADVVINSTHIIETWYPDVGRQRRA